MKTEAQKKVTKQQYEAALTNYNTAFRNGETLKQKRDGKLAAINEEYAKSIGDAEGRANEAREIIQNYCTQNRDAIFGDGQSIKNWVGTIGFRKSPPSVVLAEGITTDKVLELLRKKGFADFILTKEDLNKKSILNAAGDKKLMSKLEGIGISIDTDKESFYIKPD